MSPAQAAMIMRKLEGMEKALEQTRAKADKARQGFNQLKADMDLASKRLTALGSENESLRAQLESQDRILVQMVRHG